MYNTVHASNDVIKNDNYNDKMVFGRRTLNQGFIQYPITRRQHIQVDGLMKIKKRDDNIKNRVKMEIMNKIKHIPNHRATNI